MNRIHAPEIEDFEWCPALLRDALTDVLRASAETLRLFDDAADVVRDVLDESGASRIVDLCSGGGGPAMTVVDALERRHGRKVNLVLTDKFPNVAAFDRMAARRPGRISGRRESIDATALPEDLTGLRTVFNALHHFRPKMARAIFESAARARQPIASFEIVERSLQGAFIVGGAPIFTAASLPFLTPRTWKRVAITWGVPLLPAMIAWDGFASCLRAYSPRELHALVDGVGDASYEFRVIMRRIPWTPFRITALVGVPRSSAAPS